MKLNSKYQCLYCFDEKEGKLVNKFELFTNSCLSHTISIHANRTVRVVLHAVGGMGLAIYERTLSMQVMSVFEQTCNHSHLIQTETRVVKVKLSIKGLQLSFIFLVYAIVE